MHLIKALVLALLTTASIQSNAEDFLAGNSDIPIMNGLKINTTEQMDFDTPTGQLLVLEGNALQKTGEDVLKFYENTLPQLGWIQKEKGVFVRQNDTLTLSILKNKKPAKIRFDISLTNDM